MSNSCVNDPVLKKIYAPYENNKCFSQLIQIVLVSFKKSVIIIERLYDTITVICIILVV